MQGSREGGKQYKGELAQLASKISRLRKRLVSFGYSMEEVVTIIMEQFLKLQKIDWSALKYTTLFHHLKSTYRVDSATTEMIMCLHNSVPNLHAPQVCQYLLSVLEYNSLAFGINLTDSSSDSNESGSAIQRRLLSHSKRRIKSKGIREREKKRSGSPPTQNGRKKMHKTEEKEEEGEHPIREPDFERIFMNRPKTVSLEFEVNLQKELKKEIQSEDSDG